MVTLLDGIISKESPNRINDPHPIFLTAPASSEFTTPSPPFYHGLLGRFTGLLKRHLCICLRLPSTTLQLFSYPISLNIP